MFNSRKTAQVAALFAAKQGGTINILKLTKLLYLADREAMAQCGLPITYDHVVSMDQGPVLSRSLNLCNGSIGGAEGAAWDEWISDRENHDLCTKIDVTREVLDELSDFDIEIIDNVWERFGYMDRWEIRDYTHQNCPEWEDPKGSSIPIREEKILDAIGFSTEDAEHFASAIRKQRYLDFACK